MIAEKAADELLEYFGRLIVFYQQFLELETNKYQILRQSQLEHLDQTLKDEQAFTLKARGFELERKALLEKFEIPEVTFKELISLYPPGLQQKAFELYHTLSLTLNHLKLTSDRCNRLLKLKLRRISFLKANMEHQPESRGYGETQAKEMKRDIFSQKI